VRGRGVDFDTTRDGRKGRSVRGYRPTCRGTSVFGSWLDGSITIPPVSRKAVLVHLALEAWRVGEIDSRNLGQVRGREVDEAGFQRALYRSSISEIEYHLRSVLKGRHIIVEGRLPEAGRYALVRLGAGVEEQELEDEPHYVDMTPLIFIVAAVAIAVRYKSLGLDDQVTYILSGIFFAVIYGLRPFISKLMRPKDK
jgi:hypothetical protein